MLNSHFINQSIWSRLITRTAVMSLLSHSIADPVYTRRISNTQRFLRGYSEHCADDDQAQYDDEEYDHGCNQNNNSDSENPPWWIIPAILFGCLFCIPQIPSYIVHTAYRLSHEGVSNSPTRRSRQSLHSERNHQELPPIHSQEHDTHRSTEHLVEIASVIINALYDNKPSITNRNHTPIQLSFNELTKTLALKDQEDHQITIDNLKKKKDGSFKINDWITGISYNLIYNDRTRKFHLTGEPIGVNFFLMSEFIRLKKSSWHSHNTLKGPFAQPDLGGSTMSYIYNSSSKIFELIIENCKYNTIIEENGAKCIIGQDDDKFFIEENSVVLLIDSHGNAITKPDWNIAREKQLSYQFPYDRNRGEKNDDLIELNKVIDSLSNLLDTDSLTNNNHNNTEVLTPTHQSMM